MGTFVPFNVTVDLATKTGLVFVSRLEYQVIWVHTDWVVAQVRSLFAFCWSASMTHHSSDDVAVVLGSFEPDLRVATCSLCWTVCAEEAARAFIFNR